MTAITFEIYDALRSIDVPEDKAQSVARAFDQHNSATKSDIDRVEKELKGDINRVEKKIIGIEKELVMIKWTQGIIIAAVILPLLKGVF